MKETVTKQKSDSIPELQIESFDVPASISGCSGLYAADTVQLQQQKFMFVTNLRQTAFVKINGKLLRLSLHEKSSDDATVNETYEAEGVKVQLQSTENKRLGDELFLYTGTLVITKGNQSIQIPVVGEVGC